MAYVFDKAALEKATELLLDPKWGASRQERTLAVINGVQPNYFRGTVKPLREIVYLAEADKPKALRLLELAGAERERLVVEFKTNYPTLAKARLTRSNNTAIYRQRQRYAILTEDLKRALEGKKFVSKAERSEILDAARKEWYEFSESYRKARIREGCLGQEAAAMAAKALTEMLKQRYEAAKEALAASKGIQRGLQDRCESNEQMAKLAELLKEK